MGSGLGRSGGLSAPPTAFTPFRSPRTFWTRTSQRPGRTRSGAPTSPTSGPARAGSTSPSSSTCSPGEQVDDDGEEEPALAGPDVGDVGAPLLVRPGRCEVLVQKVRGDRKGVKAVGGALEPPLLPSPEPIVAHQPGDAPAADGKPIVAKFVHHARAAVGPVRRGEGRADMSQQHHIVTLS